MRQQVLARSFLLSFVLQLSITIFSSCTKEISIISPEDNPGELQITWHITNPTITGAADGSIKLIVTGGVPPYSFLWSTGSTEKDLSECAAGSYTVHVKDFVDSVINKTIVINDPEPPGMVKSILFVGNSLTGFNNMPQMVAQLATHNNKTLYFDTFLQYGKSIRSFYKSSALSAKIQEKNWDYIVFQSDDITAFPDMYDQEIEVISFLKGLVMDHCVTSKIVYMMVWGIRGGVTVGGEGYYSYEEYFQKIYTGTCTIASVAGCSIAPVGQAWYSVFPTSLRDSLFDSDNAHPSLAGSYLSACVFYTIIYKQSVENTSYYADISEKDAGYFQKIGSDTVLNDLPLWHIE